MTSSHEHLFWHTNATSAQEACRYAPPTTPRLSSLGHVHVIALVAIPVGTSILPPRYQVLNAPLPSENILHVCRKISSTAYPAADAPVSTSVKLGEASEVDLDTQEHSRISCYPTFQLYGQQYRKCPGAWYAFVKWHQHPAKTTGDEADFSARNSAAAWTKHKLQLHLNSARAIFLRARAHLM